MKCPFCGNLKSKVVDSRPADEGYTIRRRRECSRCCMRFTTYERVDRLPLMVVKKDGRRESFNREKILNGIMKATEKGRCPWTGLTGWWTRLKRSCTT